MVRAVSPGNGCIRDPVLHRRPGRRSPSRGPRTGRARRKCALLEFKLVKSPEIARAVLEDIDRAFKDQIAKSGAAANGNVDSTQAPKPRTDTEVSLTSLLGEGTTLGGDSTQTDSTVLVDQDIVNDRPFISLLAGLLVAFSPVGRGLLTDRPRRMRRGE